ncbi:helix-turn-helix transcriptional regulator [Paracoccus pacificus]|uniref:Helix-turn-helix transcriptional regulator n=1 Tax=Paracoccus pacificus TaxID=1463598 RepID=A0ABW4RD54_9RHOB
MTSDLIDRIYEAAFLPETWPDVLDRLARATGSASGALLVFDSPDSPPRFKSSALTHDALEEFVATDQWRSSQRVPALFPELLSGRLSWFFYLTDHVSRFAGGPGDSVGTALARLGLGEQIVTLIPAPGDAAVCFTLERRVQDGRHAPATVDLLNDLRPHLARAGLIGARLRLERAQAAVAAMEALGVPAAALSGDGRVLSTNAGFAAVEAWIRPAAFGKLFIAADEANRLFQTIIETARNGNEPLVRSVPIRAEDGRAVAVVHLLPLRRSAHDVFSGADNLLIVSPVKASLGVPSGKILTALFDLAPSEARLAAALAEGKSLKHAAGEMRISVGSARTYLSRIFEKTATNQQSQLVALLKSAQPLGPGGRDVFAPGTADGHGRS